jgi:hypothetical protein
MPENIKRGTLLNFIAYTLSGIFFFAFKIIAAHALGPEKFGIISVMLATVWVIARFLATGIKDCPSRSNSGHLRHDEDIAGLHKIHRDSIRPFSARLSCTLRIFNEKTPFRILEPFLFLCRQLPLLLFSLFPEGCTPGTPRT